MEKAARASFRRFDFLANERIRLTYGYRSRLPVEKKRQTMKSGNKRTRSKYSYAYSCARETILADIIGCMTS
eukprot:scaffold182375_cov43-Prasinocladus_malaysianus.AAC.2